MQQGSQDLKKKTEGWVERRRRKEETLPLPPLSAHNIFMITNLKVYIQ
jgi:hypothetical protein